jgi:hypothetical protein
MAKKLSVRKIFFTDSKVELYLIQNTFYFFFMSGEEVWGGIKEERHGNGRARKIKCFEPMQLWRRRDDNQQNLLCIVNNICNIMFFINVGERGGGIVKVQDTG